MERQSTKHSARLDDELKREVQSLERGAPVESHREEFRDQESPADGEPLPASRTTAAGQLAPDAATARTELSRHVRGSAFPADRDRLLDEARANNAPAAVLSALDVLPAGKTFTTLYEVWEGLGGNVEHVEGRKQLDR